MPMLAVLMKSSVNPIAAPGASEVAGLVMKGLPCGAAHRVAPEMPKSEAVCGTPSSTRENGPKRVESDVFFTLMVWLKCKVERL